VKTLRKYIVTEMLISVFSVLSLFVALFFLFDLIQGFAEGEQSNLGISLTLFRSALETPSWAYELVPLSALTGALIALARFASYSEYVVMRSAGMSLKSLILTLSIVALIVSSVTFFVGEVIVPRAERVLQTIDVNSELEQHVIAQTFRSGHWIKDQNRVINVTRLTKNFDLSGILIFELDENDRSVNRMIKASTGVIDENKWQLSDVHVTDIYSDRLVRSSSSSLILNTLINPKILNSLLLGEAHLTYLELARYIEHLEDNGEDVYRYKSAQWSKISHLVTVFLLVLIAVAFINFESRGRHAGFWIFIGTTCGVGLYFMTQLITSIGTIGRWHPATFSLIPIMLILIVAYYFVANRERR
jgi:lipopolysaccharide export system permease protein